VKATILDTKTGLIGTQAIGCRSWHYAEGNWSCDCNRNLWMQDQPSAFKCQSERFLVIAVEYEDIDEGEEYTLKELNPDYSPVLLERAVNLFLALTELAAEASLKDEHEEQEWS
jgi:hypothetical protein